jgi:hypothetical protein
MSPVLDNTEDLTRFRYHTGATLRKLAPDEPCRLLFRDIGPQGMALFLRGKLTRLAGPFAPILYARTADYQEPYTDSEPIGRLVFLQPKTLVPWHSGVSSIFVASVRQPLDCANIGFVPASVGLSRAEQLLDRVTDTFALRELFGGREFDELTQDTLAGLDRLNAELAETERHAEPLRKKLQSRHGDDAEAVREWLTAHQLREADLCGAWHHVPRERRLRLREALQEWTREASC